MIGLHELVPGKLAVIVHLAEHDDLVHVVGRVSDDDGASWVNRVLDSDLAGHQVRGIPLAQADAHIEAWLRRCALAASGRQPDGE